VDLVEVDGEVRFAKGPSGARADGEGR